MGRKEFGVGQDAREARRQANQIIAVGADAVQQDDKLGRLGALKGSERWSRKVEWCVDGPLPPLRCPRASRPWRWRRPIMNPARPYNT